MLTSIVKCHLLDEELVKMTMEALDTIYPYCDETIIVRTDDSVTTPEFEEYIDKNGIGVVTAQKGFPHFVKTGMMCADGDYVAVLNNDILFKGDWVKPLMGLFEDNTLLVHPKMLGWDEPILTGRQVKENIDPKEGMFFSAFILNKKLYEKVGWDTAFDYWGYDDWDFYYRARKAGYDCLWTDIVQYKHKGGATINKIGREKFEQFNKLFFETKHKIKPQDINWYAL